MRAQRVNAVSPGPVTTDLGKTSLQNEPDFPPLGEAGAPDIAAEESQGVELPQFDPSPRLFSPSLPLDIAYAILFLASDESAAMTGIDVPVGKSTASCLLTRPGTHPHPLSRLALSLTHTCAVRLDATMIVQMVGSQSRESQACKRGMIQLWRLRWLNQARHEIVLRVSSTSNSSDVSNVSNKRKWQRWQLHHSVVPSSS